MTKRANPVKQQYTVFISSTYLDNQIRRKVVEDAVLAAGMTPIGMERFTASPYPTVDECLRMAAEADLFVGIIAHRYGWIPEGYQTSITELEYLAAKDAGKSRLMFILDSKLPRYDEDYDQGEERWKKQDKLQAFKDSFTRDQMPALFDNESLGHKVLQAALGWKDKQAPGENTTPTPEPLPDPTSDLSDEIKEYRKQIEAIHAALPLAGFKTKLRVPIDLADLYVPLSAMIDLRGVGDASFADAADAETQLKLSGRSLDINLIEAFIESKKRNQSGLVILGDPGSGKTTHLKRLLIKCLREGSESLGLQEGMLPVFLPLRELDDIDRRLDAFIRDKLNQTHPQLPLGFGQRLLKRGKLLLLFDGLDEVAEERKREQVSKWIDRAQQTHLSCCCVVTCRFAGYTDRTRLSERFMELHIRPLSQEQAEKFVYNWYRIVEKGLAVDPVQGEKQGREKAFELIERLKQPDFRARRVFGMTRNPLLLANLCLVHFDRKKLPQRRADLYEECVDVLLERWREAKELQSSITAKTGRRVLQPAALWLHQKENRTRATADELAPVIQPVLQTTEYDKGDAKDFLKTVRDESGILVGWGDNSYGFMHLGFQEYLAAREIGRRAFTDKSVLKELVAHYGDSWWQEVSLLLLALEEFPCFEPFMRQLVSSPCFVEQRELIETYLDDAIAFSEAPFIELIQADPRKDKRLWQRQRLALQILEGRKSESLDLLKKKLKAHPSADIQAWLGGQKSKAKQTVVHAEKGGYELVLVPSGVFQMGSPKSEKGHSDTEEPLREVELPTFYLGRYPVTNEEYGRFISENKGVSEPLYWGERRFNQPRQPVVGVSWHEAKQYAQWAGLRLATEAEWEYACRARTTTPFYFGETISTDQANYDGNYVYGKGEKGEYRRQTTPVDTFAANAFGLHDMHGNVFEWIEDNWHDSYTDAPSDGRAWVDARRGEYRVVRGGCWRIIPLYCRCAFRYRYHPVNRHHHIGFRLALDFQ